jgi:glycerol kinase
MIGDHMVPIAGIAGDQQAALFGQACVEPGSRRTPTAPVLSAAQHRDQAVASSNNLVTTVAWKRDGRLEYALEGSVFIARRRRAMAARRASIIRKASDIEALARACPTTAASISCRRSRVSARRIGTPMRAARSSA